MDKIKFPKNFNLFRENINEIVSAFRANKSIVDITREVFHNIIATPLSCVRPLARKPAPLLALVQRVPIQFLPKCPLQTLLISTNQSRKAQREVAILLPEVLLLPSLLEGT